jgi:hypothetical protein
MATWCEFACELLLASLALLACYRLWQNHWID